MDSIVHTYGFQLTSSSALEDFNPDRFNFPAVCKIQDATTFEAEARRLISQKLTVLDLADLTGLRNDYFIYQIYWRRFSDLQREKACLSREIKLWEELDFIRRSESALPMNDPGRFRLQRRRAQVEILIRELQLSYSSPVAPRSG